MLVTAREAAEILDMKVNSIYMAASQGRLNRHAPTHTRRQYDLDELEQMSLARLKPRGGGHPYWLTVAEAAEVLGVVPTRVRALMDKEKIPHVTAPNGRRYVRRHQFEVVANARAARAGRFP
jgi:excisionase family DNA binding protein